MTLFDVLPPPLVEKIFEANLVQRQLDLLTRSGLVHADWVGDTRHQTTMELWTGYDLALALLALGDGWSLDDPRLTTVGLTTRLLRLSISYRLAGVRKGQQTWGEARGQILWEDAVCVAQEALARFDALARTWEDLHGAFDELVDFARLQKQPQSGAPGRRDAYERWVHMATQSELTRFPHLALVWLRQEKPQSWDPTAVEQVRRDWAVLAWAEDELRQWKEGIVKSRPTFLRAWLEVRLQGRHRFPEVAKFVCTSEAADALLREVEERDARLSGTELDPPFFRPLLKAFQEDAYRTVARFREVRAALSAEEGP